MIAIGPAKAKKPSMYDGASDDDEAPPSSRSGKAEDGEGSADLDNLRTILGDADEEQLEAFRDLVRSCFEQYEKEPHEEYPHDEE